MTDLSPAALLAIFAVAFLAGLAVLHTMAAALRHQSDVHALKRKVDQLRSAQFARMKAAAERRGTADVTVIDDGYDVDEVPDDGFDVDVLEDTPDRTAAQPARAAA